MKKRFFVAGSVSDRLLAYLIIAHSAKMLNRSKYSTLPFHRINSKRNFFCWSFRFCCSCLCNFARKKFFAFALNVLHRDRLLLHIQILNLAKKSLQQTLPYYDLNYGTYFGRYLSCWCLRNFARTKSFSLVLDILYQDKLLLHLQILYLAKNPYSRNYSTTVYTVEIIFVGVSDFSDHVCAILRERNFLLWL